MSGRLKLLPCGCITEPDGTIVVICHTHQIELDNVGRTVDGGYVGIKR